MKSSSLAYNIRQNRDKRCWVYAAADVHGAMSYDQTKLYTSVEVTPVPLRVRPQPPLVPSFASVVG